MPQVSPGVLTWARETAGLTREEAARKLHLGEAYGMVPAERLAALETGATQPSRPLLARMAKSYRTPLIVFYLDEPPRPSEVGTDFGMLPSAGISAEQEARVQALVRDVLARQGIVRSQLEDDDMEVQFVGTIAMADGRSRALDALEQVVDGAPDTDAPPRDFEDLRAAVERAGAFVLLQGDMGSHHSAIETATFRGFAVADRLAPFIVINSNDARTAWSFTLLHEVVHLLLGQTGISGADTDSDVERFCNDVASEYLLPSSVVEALDVGTPDPDRLVEALGRVSSEWRVSRALVAYRLYRSGKIDHGLYRQLAQTFRQQWKEERRQRGENRKGQGGPNYYTVRRHRVGDALLQLVTTGLGEGTLSTTKAALALGVKPTQVGQVLGMRTD